jgi:hypothetical protein
VLSPSPGLPDAARERAGRLLWDRLLAPTDEDSESDDTESDGDPERDAA